MVVNGVFHNIHEYGFADAFNHSIYLDITNIIRALFACGAVLITMGAVLGKLTHSQMLVMAFIEIIF